MTSRDCSSRKRKAEPELRRWPLSRRCKRYGEAPRNWVDLPRDVTKSILRRVDQAEILKSVQFVCSTWLSICRDPQMWRYVELRWSGVKSFHEAFRQERPRRSFYRKLCRQAVRYSSYQLTDLTIDGFGSDDFLMYLSKSKRLSQIKCLRIRNCSPIISNGGLRKALANLASLEELELLRAYCREDTFVAIARSCPNLKTLKCNRENCLFGRSLPDPKSKPNRHAFAIAQNFPRLRNLELVSNEMTDDGLVAILDGCPELESLNLQLCLYLRMEGDLRQRCFRQIKYLRFPLDGVLDGIDPMFMDPELGQGPSFFRNLVKFLPFIELTT